MEIIVSTREEEYKLLLKRINSFLEGYRQNLALIGPDFSGKTYLIEQLLNANFPSNVVFPIYIDLENLSFHEFIRVTYTSLLFHYLKSCQKPHHYNLDLLILESQNHIPKTTDKIKGILTLLGTKEKIGFDSIMEVLNEFLSETNTKILFILKSFTCLKDFPKKVLSELIKYIISQKNIMFILTNNKNKKAEDLLSQELNMLFGSFEKIYVDNLSYRDAENYLNGILGDKLSSTLRKFLIELTGGFPFYLDIIMDKLAHDCKDIIDLDILTEKLTYILINQKSCLYQVFSNKINSIRNLFGDDFLINPLLILIACGYTRKKDLFTILKKDTNNLNTKLAKLLEINILNKNGSFYFIADKLFSFWISSVFKHEINFPLIFFDDKKRLLNKIIKDRYEEFSTAAVKDSFERFIDLVQLFKDDTVKTGKKSISLPQIKRLKIVPAHSKDMKFVIGEARQYYLILAFKEGEPEDTEILEFSNRCSYFRNKQPKKIFITLKRGDETAKVLAKEKRLHFWEKEDINLLLRLYNKPLII